MLLKTNAISRQEKLKADTLFAVNNLMSGIAGHTPTLLAVVAGGPMEWRNRCQEVTKGLAIDERIADHIFAFFCDQVRRKFGRERTAGQLLDSLVVHTPPTKKEIAESWKVESASSEEGRRHLYGRDGHPEELIKQLADQDLH